MNPLFIRSTKTHLPIDLSVNGEVSHQIIVEKTEIQGAIVSALEVNFTNFILIST